MVVMVTVMVAVMVTVMVGMVTVMATVMVVMVAVMVLMVAMMVAVMVAVMLLWTTAQKHTKNYVSPRHFPSALWFFLLHPLCPVNAVADKGSTVVCSHLQTLRVRS